MSLRNKLLRPWFRFMASQLGKPHGLLAPLTGKKMNESNHALYQLTFATMNPEDKDQILEIGFGNGKFFADLNARAHKLQISGIDLSHEMVTEAVKNNSDLFESGFLKVMVGDSNDLPFPDNSFNKVFCINVIYFWEKPADHLKEIYRVLKPGGQIYCGFRPAQTMIQLPFTKFGFRLYDEKDWQGILEAANFHQIRTSIQTDPVTRIGPSKIKLESICMSGKKQCVADPIQVEPGERQN